MPFDGGVVALSGFLYEAWVVGGLLAKSQVLEEDDSHLDALVSLTKNAQLQFERFDQDRGKWFHTTTFFHQRSQYADYPLGPMGPYREDSHF
jgi:hypothetical protein